MKKILLIIAIFSLTACTPNEADFKSKVPLTNSGASSGANSVAISDNQQLAQQSAPQSAPQYALQLEIPSEINLDVPFFPQAPDADWGIPWQEACEEAASILAYYSVTDKPLTKEKFKEEIHSLVEWENKNFGDYKHTNISQTAEMIKGYFGYSDYQILEKPTIEQMKEELSKGHIIVAPFAGRQLGNPFYSNEGPLYHMMVIKGYDEKHFITNDVGTKRGQNFIYPYNVIMSAMHEWNDTDMNLGAKKIIVLY